VVSQALPKCLQPYSSRPLAQIASPQPHPAPLTTHVHGCRYEGIMHMHNVWTTPLEAIAIIALALVITKGLYALPTLWILIVVIPLQCE